MGNWAPVTGAFAGVVHENLRELGHMETRDHLTVFPRRKNIKGVVSRVGRIIAACCSLQSPGRPRIT